MSLQPYSLNIHDASAYFGLATGTLYNWINLGKLQAGTHYLKAGRKPLIIVGAFIKLLEDDTHGRI